MVDISDVLLKAASDVESGMWCRDMWFILPNDEPRAAAELWHSGVSHLSLEDAAKSSRCAEGSLAFVTKQLGGSLEDYKGAVRAVDDHLLRVRDVTGGVLGFNHFELSDADPFTAGQQLATLFRETAASL